MATQEFKLAVNNSDFPFLFKRASRPIAQPGLDIAPRTSVGFVGSPERFDYNQIKLLYCENVLPTGTGFMSVATQEDIIPYSPAVTDFDQALTIRDSAERNYVFAPGRGKNYILSPTTGLWTSYNSFSWASDKILVSRAYVNGRTFIMYERDRLIEFDPSIPQFNTIALTLPSGFAITDIRGAVGASNYLVLFTDTSILWSSTLDVTNFNDPIGKSGRQIPTDLKGRITACVPISGGFIIYTERNAVAAFFTNNPDTPFSFREVQNSGGVSGYEQVTSEANQAEHYCYGSSGIQVLNLQQATTIHPDCADFLSQKTYESWNTTTAQVDSTTLVTALDVKLHLLANRYLIISYGKINLQFTYALVYDLAYRSWGKIRCNHVDVTALPSNVVATLGFRYFELTARYTDYDVAYQDLVQAYGNILPIRSGFAFLQNTGALQVLVSDETAQIGNGVAIIGHIQIVRGRAVTFKGVVFDGFYADPAPKLRLLGSIPRDGYNRNSIYTPTLDQSTPEMVSYQGRETFENFDLALEGKFVLTGAIVETQIHGSR